MIDPALKMDPGDGENVAFMRNHRGEVCIAFYDPSYARAESILLDRADLSVYAILPDGCHLVGHVSEVMAKAFEQSRKALLTGLRPDGNIMEMIVPVEVQAA